MNNRAREIFRNPRRARPASAVASGRTLPTRHLNFCRVCYKCVTCQKLNHLGKFVSNQSMNTKILLSVVTSLIATAVYAFDPPPVGSAAPDFSLPDAKGGTHSLSQYKGKYVVLEWFSPARKAISRRNRRRRSLNLGRRGRRRCFSTRKAKRGARTAPRTRPTWSSLIRMEKSPMKAQSTAKQVQIQPTFRARPIT